MIFQRIHGCLEPFDTDAHKLMLETSNGDAIAFDKQIKPRNVKFHKKYFALLKFAFEHWSPGELSGKKYDGVVPEKNFDRFREDLTILSGHFRQTIRADNSLCIEAKSISFASMDENQFAELYDKTINVILERILTNYSREDLEEVVREILLFG